MPTYTLTYFNLRARGEVARQLFALAEVDYTDERIPKSAWMELKGETPFGQLPVLKVDDVVLCQSDVISAYLARTFGYAGETELEAAQIAMIAGCINDSIAPYLKTFAAELDNKQELREKYQKEQLPAYLVKLEKLLVSNNGGNGYFIGNKVSYADLKLESALDFCQSTGVAVDMSPCPQLAALRTRVANIPQLKQWIAKRPVTPQ